MARYEDLRQGVLEGRAAQGPLGLALFLREGMRAWMDAWLSCPASLEARPETPSAPAEPEPLVSAPRELVEILAGMALAQIQGEAA